MVDIGPIAGLMNACSSNTKKYFFFAVFEVFAIQFCRIALLKIVCAIQRLYPFTAF